MRAVAASVEQHSTPGRIGEVIELYDRRAADNAPPHISIIIPVRNDAEALTRTLDHLDRIPGIESAQVLVAAAGDRQGTSFAVAGRAQLLWPDGSTRAILMNAGAARARAEVLWFLHADSLPPAKALELIRQALLPERVVGGAFAHRFAESVWSLQVINWMNRLRYCLTHNYYGDQGLFVRTAVFRQMGGYRPLQLMEDLDFSQRLKRHRGDKAHPRAAAHLRSPLPGPRPLAHVPVHRLVVVVAHPAVRHPALCRALAWSGASSAGESMVTSPPARGRWHSEGGGLLNATSRCFYGGFGHRRYRFHRSAGTASPASCRSLGDRHRTPPRRPLCSLARDAGRWPPP